MEKTNTAFLRDSVCRDCRDQNCEHQDCGSESSQVQQAHVPFSSLPRILFVVPDLEYFLTHRSALTHRARDLGYEIHIASPQFSDRASGRSDYYIHKFSAYPRVLHPLLDLCTLVSLMALYRRVRPHLVHHIGMKLSIYGSLAGRLTAIDSVINNVSAASPILSPDGWLSTLRASLGRLLCNFSIRNSPCINVCHNSEDMRFFENVLHVAPSRLRIMLGSGVDLGEFRSLPEPKGTPTILLASRLLDENGVRNFAQASALLQAEGHTARFLIVGKPFPVRPGAITDIEIQRWKREGLLVHHAADDDMREFIAASHVVCLLSDSPDTPKVLMEAAACGRAIIATKVASIENIFMNGQNALLIPPHDSRSLAAAIELLLRDHELRLSLAENARRTIEEAGYSQESVLRQIFQLYDYALYRAKQ